MPITSSLRRRARPVTAVLVLSLVLAACGGDDGGETTTATDETTTTTGAPAETTTTVEDDEDDEDDDGAEGGAADVNVQLADLPDGWAEGPEPDDDADTEDDIFGECIGLDRDEIEERQEDQADSPEFSNTEAIQQTVSSSTTIFDDESVPAQIFDELRSDDTVPCLRAAFEEEFTSNDDLDGVEVEITEFDLVDDFPTFGDESLLLSAVIVLSAEGQEFPAHLDLIFIRTGEVATFLSALNLGEPTAPALITDLADAVADRQAAAV